MDSLTEWVVTREPPAPDELRAWLKIPHGGPVVPERLLGVGLLHLKEAVARPSRDREAAYQLLAADALITYACEAAAETGDVRGVLREALALASVGESLS